MNFVLEHLHDGKYSLTFGHHTMHVREKDLVDLAKEIEAMLYDKWVEEYGLD